MQHGKLYVLGKSLPADISFSFNVRCAALDAKCEDNIMAAANEFYLRYYTGHKGKFGHEFLEFEFRPDGKMRYANNSNYKNDTMIRKEVFVNEGVIEALKKIVKDSDIIKEDDRNWPMPDKVGRQELEVSRRSHRELENHHRICVSQYELNTSCVSHCMFSCLVPVVQTMLISYFIGFSSWRNALSSLWKFALYTKPGMQ
jgi:hypothetical protein